MADWVSTEYTVTDTPENIQQLFDELEAAKKHQEEEFNTNGFGENWLGNLMLHIGYTWHSVSEGHNGCPFCRGQIEEYWIEKAFPDTLRINTESAYYSPHECIANFIRFFCPDAEITSERWEVVFEEL